ncbi:IS1182 family transposase [Candidatus Kaiserbacteria bacterium]|nr:IS1182 family transposase [Candidatus Kaiserbacteria bacterium]
MARYKPYNYDQSRFVAIDYRRQILPGTFEYAIDRLINERVDMEVFEARYRNDTRGATAYDPGLVLKVILFGYSKGITSSRGIEELCRTNVICMALSADIAPHFSTIAEFVAKLPGEIISLFRDVLLVCDEAGLIGREMFAVDGVKLPSNASKEWSGTKEEFQNKRQKMQRAIEVLTQSHRNTDACERDLPQGPNSGLLQSRLEDAASKQVDTLRKACEKIDEWSAANEDKRGASGQVIKSNITDNDSAKMKGPHGVIQGYSGIAVVDAKHQIVVHAQAHGSGNEQDTLIPTLEATQETFRAIASAPGAVDILKQAAVSADAGFHTESNVRYCIQNNLDAYVADKYFRKRDPRFQNADRFKPGKELTRAQKDAAMFTPEDFKVAEDFSYAICPAGKRMYRNGRDRNLQGYDGIKFSGAKRDCLNCPLRHKCLRDPDKTLVRQFTHFLGRSALVPETYTEKMKKRIDSVHGRYQYSRRLGTVEPVFANICNTLGLRRFSHRGKAKVNAQWMMFCMVHNIGKLRNCDLMGGKKARSNEIRR